MQFYRKTRRSFARTLIKPLIKIFIFIAILIIIVFIIGNLEFPTPNKIIKHKIPNEKFKIIK